MSLDLVKKKKKKKHNLITTCFTDEKNLRLGAVKEFVQSHTISLWQSKCKNPELVL